MPVEARERLLLPPPLDQRGCKPLSQARTCPGVLGATEQLLQGEARLLTPTAIPTPARRPRTHAGSRVFTPTSQAREGRSAEQDPVSLRLDSSSSLPTGSPGLGLPLHPRHLRVPGSQAPRHASLPPTPGHTRAWGSAWPLAPGRALAGLGGGSRG